MMERSGAASYVNAKANGMLQKSFIGSRAVKLFSVHTLSELWSLLFSEELPSVPELLLAKEIEAKALQSFIGQYKKLLGMYNKPDAVALSLLQYYEYENLKNIGTALSKNAKEMPSFADITPYNILNYKAWPKLSKITEGTSLAWYNTVPQVHDIQALDNKLDLQYMRALWRSINQLPVSERSPVRSLILEEFVLKNILWVLRLKVYYSMNRNDILSRLAYESDEKAENDIFAAPAIGIIDKDVQKFDDWANWKYLDFLNPHEEGAVWSVDPCWVETYAHKTLQKKALSQFHRYPLTAMVLVSWFKIKQNEYDTICAAVETLRLGADAAQVMEMTGIETARQR